MIFKALRSDLGVEDSAFDDLYPTNIKILGQRHWTPVDVAKKAAKYLVQHPKDKILDIGAGAGKFCLVGAACTEGMFYGVEQRESLVEISNGIAQKHQIDNVEFIHANINQISFSDYDAFYFYNSFYENIDTTCPIDHSILPNQELYHIYTEYLRQQLKQLPIGTRIVSYWSGWDEIPTSFDLEQTACRGLLNFWKKII
ncbi:methyltransferase domain-containing protein [Sphingobacterium faecium]|jgi:hypothetical protein|uniref:methyltransferase domain-containing protein n=1 Tax=Sphingobacterium faecium TaxID=34087 RepID=UPI003207A16F